MILLLNIARALIAGQPDINVIASPIVLNGLNRLR